ncbi:MAG TPA: glycosyltransferase [Candidatus Nanoarchaeia archaeon]|nr:glycosyltransferase [Candidatus Nanoarchaeia archaeon]
MKLPFVSILIPVYQAKDTLAALAESLKNLDYPKSQYEVLFILDVACGKEEKKILRKYPFKVYRNTRRGSAANRNLGVQKASKKAVYYAFTDADCYADKEWLKELVRAMEDAPENVVCVGGVNLTPKTESKVAQVIGALQQTTLGGGVSGQTAQKGKQRYVSSLPNCNALYKKKAWQQEKQDESFMVGQDGEFNYRLSKRGYRFLLIPNAKIWHHREHFSHTTVRNVFWNFFYQMYRYGKATGEIAKKHPGILLVRWYALPPIVLVVGSLLALLSWLSGALDTVFIPLFYIGLLLYLIVIVLTMCEAVILTGRITALLSPILLIGHHVFYGVGFLRGLFKTYSKY